MNKYLLEVTIILLVFLSSCVSVAKKESKERMVDDFGSPQKVKLLKDRAEEYWSAMVKGDLKKAYTYFDPFYRSRVTTESFLERHGSVKYHEFSVIDVKVEGNIGTVKIKTKYSVPKMVVKQKEFTIPETDQEFEERWLFVYDNWYKEYYLQLFEYGFIYY